MSIIYAPRLVAERDHRVETFCAIINRCASKDSGAIIPQVEYEQLEQSAARTAGFRNAEEAREALFLRATAE
jgi:hypothetical protein